MEWRLITQLTDPDPFAEVRTLGLREPRPSVITKGFTQEALGHNSKEVHRAFAKRAFGKLPSLEEYEERAVVRVEPGA